VKTYTCDKYLTDDQYLTALVKLRDHIQNNQQVTTFGFHPAEFFCNWGICARNTWLWNTEDVMLFPEHMNPPDPVLHPKTPQPHHKCPLDTRKESQHFSSCRKFCSATGEELNRQEVLEIINQLIHEATTRDTNS